MNTTIYMYTSGPEGNPTNASLIIDHPNSRITITASAINATMVFENKNTPDYVAGKIPDGYQQLTATQVNQNVKSIPWVKDFEKMFTDVEMAITEMQFQENSPRDIGFYSWANQHYKTFGKPGMIMQVYALATFFSSRIFEIEQMFPFVYINGAPATGKTQLAYSINTLFNSNSAFTLAGALKELTVRAMYKSDSAVLLIDDCGLSDHSKLHKLKKYYNSPVATVEHKDFKGCPVPLIQGIVITTNDATKMEHAFSERVIHVSMTKQDFSDQDKSNLKLLKELEENGIGYILRELEPYWKVFRDNYSKYSIRANYLIYQNSPTSWVKFRLIRNYLPLIATYSLLCDFGFKFPYTDSELIDYVKECIQDHIKTR